jgi:F-type H+-transporting ATPase subunit a
VKNLRLWIIILVLLAGSYLLTQALPYDLVRPSVVAEPIFMIGGFAVSNAIFISWVVTILLLVLTFAATRNASLVPSGLQNLFEIALEAILNLVRQTVGGNEKLVRWFFPFVMTFLIFILPANLLGLVPGFGPIGVVHFQDASQPAPRGVVTLFELPSAFHIPPDAHVPARTEEVKEEKAEFTPLFRAPSSDLNMTLGFALVSWLMTQVYGVLHLGPLGFLGKYIVLGRIRQGIQALFSGKGGAAPGLIGFGLIDFFVGVLEAISEVSKIISFSFRLFGNIFAGEVLLLVMAFLFPLLPLPFYFLETVVGSIQAFVFAVLTLVFMTQATTAPHVAEEHH